MDGSATRVGGVTALVQDKFYTPAPDYGHLVGEASTVVSGRRAAAIIATSDLKPGRIEQPEIRVAVAATCRHLKQRAVTRSEDAL